MRPHPLLCALALAALLPARARAEVPRFSGQITPLFYRLGCSAGECHGAFAGKGGFRLSLFAAAPDADYRAIREDGLGRRIDRLRPERSLLLLKPTGAVRHGGGVVLKRGSADYRLVLDWIAAGLPRDAGENKVVSVRVEPAALSLDSKGPDRALRVFAKWAGGKEEDVTRWARFQSLDEGVAEVDSAGRARARAAGDTPVLARYGGQVGFATVTVPGELPAGLSFPDQPLTDRVDQLLAARLKRLNIVPSPLCDDEDFLRRAFLDVTGVLPLPEEARRFLDDRAPDRRAKLVDRLLASPLHSALWANKVLDWVGADDRFGAPVYAWFDRIRGQWQKNEPWARIASLDYVSGLKFNQGNDGMQILDARKVALQVGHAYLGVHLQCAQCHQHPHDVWTQNDFFAFAQAFAYVNPKVPKAWPVEQFHDTQTGQPLPPRVLGGPVIAVGPTASPRAEVMKWVVSRDNPYFARAIVNRTWAHYLGRGLFEPADAQAAANPPAHPEVLDELTRDFVAHGLDLRRLHRRILNTAAYQRGWRANPSNARDERNFSRRILRLLTAEQVVDAVNQATGTPLKVTMPYARLPAKRVITRAVELPASRFSPVDDGYVLQIFGKPLRTQASDYERSGAPSISQVLYLYNSRQLRQRIADPKGRLGKRLGEQKDDGKVVEELYLLALARRPRPAELARGLAHVKSAPSRREGHQELLWSLFNRKEFLINR